REVKAAGTKVIHISEQLQYGFQRHHTGVGTIVAALAFYFSSRRENPGKRLVHDDHVRKGLIIPQQDVVLWLVLFDEVILQQQGIKFRIDNRNLDAYDFRYHSERFPILARCIRKIGRYPVFQVFGFTYVDDVMMLVQKAVYTGLIGEIPYL